MLWVLMKYFINKWENFLSYWPWAASLASSWHVWHGKECQLISAGASRVLSTAVMPLGGGGEQHPLVSAWLLHTTWKRNPWRTALAIPFMAISSLKYYSETPENVSHNVWDYNNRKRFLWNWQSPFALTILEKHKPHLSKSGQAKCH